MNMAIVKKTTLNLLQKTKVTAQLLQDEKKSTCITTDKPFVKWREIFPNPTCVVSIIDCLVHHSEILNIEGDSFRLKEATEKNTERHAQRNQNKKQVKDTENNHV
jgi:hypothetical protein